VSLYFALLRAREKVPEIISDGGLPYQRERPQPQPPLPARSGASADPLKGKVASVVPGEWEKIAQRLADEIKTRHYSPKTLKAYALWATKFRYFTGDKTPASVSAAEVKAYLTECANLMQLGLGEATSSIGIARWHSRRLDVLGTVVLVTYLLDQRRLRFQPLDVFLSAHEYVLQQLPRAGVRVLQAEGYPLFQFGQTFLLQGQIAL
jgi:hypothetical protein